MIKEKFPFLSKNMIFNIFIIHREREKVKRDNTNIFLNNRFLYQNHVNSILIQTA